MNHLNDVDYLSLFSCLNSQLIAVFDRRRAALRVLSQARNGREGAAFPTPQFPPSNSDTGATRTEKPTPTADFCFPRLTQEPIW